MVVSAPGYRPRRVGHHPGRCRHRSDRSGDDGPSRTSRFGAARSHAAGRPMARSHRDRCGLGRLRWLRRRHDRWIRPCRKQPAPEPRAGRATRVLSGAGPFVLPAMPANLVGPNLRSLRSSEAQPWGCGLVGATCRGTSPKSMLRGGLWGTEGRLRLLDRARGRDGALACGGPHVEAVRSALGLLVSGGRSWRLDSPVRVASGLGGDHWSQPVHGSSCHRRGPGGDRRLLIVIRAMSAHYDRREDERACCRSAPRSDRPGGRHWSSAGTTCRVCGGLESQAAST